MIQRNKISSFMARMVLVVLIGGAGLLTTAGPAHAVSVNCPAETAAIKEQTVVEKTNWLQQAGLLGNVISGITSVYNTVTGMFTTLFGKMEIMKAIDQSWEWLKLRTETKLHNDRTYVDWWLIQIQDRARIAAETSVAPATVTALCRAERGKMINRNLETFQVSRSASLLRGIEMMERQIGDGKGPAYAADAAYHRRKAGAVSKADSGNDPVASRFAEEEADLDMSAEILRASVSKPPFEEPPLEKIAVGKDMVNVPIYDDAIKNQRYFRYALNYCYNLAGPTPTPPQGKRADNPDNQAVWAQYANCKALKSNFIKQCADRVFYLSRPNCKTDPELCTQSIQMCKDAQATGELEPTFESCAKPLSPYQAEYLQHTACMKGQHYVTLSSGGRKGPEMLADSERCLRNFDVWETRLGQEEANLVSAATGLQAVKSCFAGISR